MIALTKQLRVNAAVAAAINAANANAGAVHSGAAGSGDFPASRRKDLAATAASARTGGGEPVLLPAALVALSPWLQLTAPPKEEEEVDAKKKADILSPAMVKSFVKDLASGHRADK